MFNIFLGLNMDESEGIAPDWLTWVMAGFCGYQLLVDLLLEIHTFIVNHNKKKSILKSKTM